MEKKYKCDYCNDEISKTKYDALINKYNSIDCLECGKGSYYEVINSKQQTNYNNTNSQTNDNKDIGTKVMDKAKEIKDKTTDVVKATYDLPGSTQINRVIGGVTGAIVGLILPLGFFTVILGGVAGYIFAPYFVPWMKDTFNKIKNDITNKSGSKK